MSELARVVDYVNLAAFLALALVAFAQWRKHRGEPALWATLSFAALAVVALAGQILPDEGRSRAEEIAARLDLALLMLFPYLLFRFATAFRPPSRRLARLLAAMTTAMVVWTLVLPTFPEEDEAWPLSFVLYVVGFLVHWTVLSVAVAVRLWGAGRRQPTVARRRMKLLSLAAGALTAALFLAAAGSGSGPALQVAVSLLALASAIAFTLGLAPPAIVRLVWRRAETEHLQRAIADLMTLSSSEEQVAAKVLPPMAQMVGARAAALYDRSGRLLGAHGASPEALAQAEAAAAESGQRGSDSEILRLDFPLGRLVLWTSAYAPFFGAEELRLLNTLAALTGLALDRSRLFAQERDARLALEQADELKSNFVALAAHELRTPVASVAGLAETIQRRRGRLEDSDRFRLEDALLRETQRLSALVEQLLDLSRLDAAAISIHPELLAIRRCVEDLVRSAAGERRDEVRVEIEPRLEAMVDPHAFDRIVSNLVVNALRYGKAPIVVRAEQTDRHLRVTVEDRGPGVPAQLVPDLFERFTRGERTRDRSSGTGLGLAIARSYAHAHAGELLYEPATPHGARFKLVLPWRPDKGNAA